MWDGGSVQIQVVEGEAAQLIASRGGEHAIVGATREGNCDARALNVIEGHKVVACRRDTETCQFPRGHPRKSQSGCPIALGGKGCICTEHRMWFGKWNEAICVLEHRTVGSTV